MYGTYQLLKTMPYYHTVNYSEKNLRALIVKEINFYDKVEKIYNHVFPLLSTLLNKKLFKQDGTLTLSCEKILMSNKDLASYTIRPAFKSVYLRLYEDYNNSIYLGELGKDCHCLEKLTDKPFYYPEILKSKDVENIIFLVHDALIKSDYLIERVKSLQQEISSVNQTFYPIKIVNY